MIFTFLALGRCARSQYWRSTLCQEGANSFLQRYRFVPFPLVVIYNSFSDISLQGTSITLSNIVHKATPIRKENVGVIPQITLIITGILVSQNTTSCSHREFRDMLRRFVSLSCFLVVLSLGLFTHFLIPSCIPIINQSILADRFSLSLAPTAGLSGDL